ncbi:hypothetical protein [Rivularia sp. UHCC 0363]|uniref:hypothetical protein n=1 Tax=Rivularia sp. UHCC 0363 TaxID=3110244 RepID=UPI002B21ADA6|nr:hypothetical protein [Rivularia sp. UHCC 0363]MEA5596813.1 hypothetical protein [Rivularia sp. UHCC 0363]
MLRLLISTAQRINFVHNLQNYFPDLGTNTDGVNHLTVTNRSLPSALKIYPMVTI